MSSTIPSAERVRPLLQRAVGLHRSGDLSRAEAAYLEIVEIDPRHADALHLLGVLAAQSNRTGRAIALMKTAVDIDPMNFAACANLGAAFYSLGRYRDALVAYERAIAAKPDFAEAYSNRGNVLYHLGERSAALESYDRATALRPNFAEAYSNRGNVLRDLDRFDEALSSYDHAIALDGNSAQAHFNRGVALNQIKQPAAALASYDRAIALDGSFAEAHFNKSLVLLLTGDFENGWPEHEWRWANRFGSNIHEKRTFHEPLWSGRESLAGATILLYGEQGFGDCLQFCRYATLVAELGATVIVEVPQPLEHLMRTLEGVSLVVRRGGALPRCDYQCPLMSLPLAFDTQLHNIPARAAYLGSDAAKVSGWERTLGPKTAPRIGLMWNGSALQPNDRNRSFKLQEWIAQLPPGFRYVSLQRELREDDRRTLDANPHILDSSAALEDFADTAALCDCMDLVVSVCTSVAHLSGALGRKTWILLPFAADWRWLLDREDSPWYPSVTLFRQARRGDWNSLLERVQRALIDTFARSC